MLTNRAPLINSINDALLLAPQSITRIPDHNRDQDPIIGLRFTRSGRDGAAEPKNYQLLAIAR